MKPEDLTVIRELLDLDVKLLHAISAAEDEALQHGPNDYDECGMEAGVWIPGEIWQEVLLAKKAIHDYALGVARGEEE